MPVRFKLMGVNSALLSNATLSDALGQQIKDAFAAQDSNINASTVVVVLEAEGADNITAEVDVVLAAATHFHDVREALHSSQALQDAVLENTTVNLGSGPFSMTDLVFVLDSAEYVTTTATTTSDTTTTNETNDEETTTQTTVSAAYQSRVFGALLMWLAVACYPHA